MELAPSLPFVLVFLLSLSALMVTTTARGGDPVLNRSGYMDRTGGLFTRLLFEENQPQISETMAQGYMTNTELEKAVKEFGLRCASISRIYSIGKSVKGFPLLVIEISDKPGEEEAEPAFKFIGNVHGDEPVGRELLVRLANWLCDNYMKDSLSLMHVAMERWQDRPAKAEPSRWVKLLSFVTSDAHQLKNGRQDISDLVKSALIVKNVHLHILPTMNPDGFALRRRGNANNVDLNRDFPDQFYHMNDMVNLRQPETRSIMRWVKERHFTASASLHGGALVANYPWDGTQDTRKQYYACPDDRTFRYMASVYSHSHYNMSLSNEFRGGITNGAFWYPIYGGMQDWNYIHGSCFELTLEISDVKWPKANELPILWENNRKSMLNLVASLVNTGVHGRIFSSSTGHPLPATVMIKGINYTVNAGRTFGDYHRMLAPGESYEVMVSMPGYQSKFTRILLKEEALNVDFILNREEGDAGQKLQIFNHCDCRFDGWDKVELIDFLKGVQLEMFLVVSMVLLFFCCFLRRKTLFKSLNLRQPAGHKRAIV